ncbi:dihydroneopterin aldolase/2-amino-4-hydroxy-6-hydroxymethyldihydropteridine diphosphokinase,TIGR01498 [Lachnospiraceae bacterium NE2001]|nr:dihydroneopterin aldolase/2-amino-4-hydroxy-6-hydroxymethyldihydropteridine diphosphokinase,TIGR01498 [Lachnospiraceae bacterium NE2001]
MDKIRIDDIKIYAYHGVLPEEKRDGQDFFVSLELGLDLKAAGTSDKLERTVNYAEVTKLTEDTFKEVSYNTIEAAAESVIEALLAEYSLIQTITIRVSKPNAPIDADFRDVSVEITRSRHVVYLGLGSNLGDKRGYLNKAVEELTNDAFVTVRKVSDYIVTEPYGPVDQPDFLNAVMEIETPLEPDELLALIHDIEQEAGRERIVHWGPRTLDIDILLFDDMVINTKDLTIPHPEMHKREFVLEPLVEIAPYIYHPTLKRNVVQMLEDLKASGYASVDHVETEDFEERGDLDVNGKTVVYAGVPGAYAEEAAIKFFGDRVNYTNVKRFDDVVKAVADGDAEYGVIPIENSSAGFVTGNYDIIRTGEVKIVAQVTIDINHCLLGLKEAKLSDITKVYSHRQGLLQCKEYIDQNGFKSENVSNTARAAERVSDEGLINQAAISSERAAEIYGLKILDRNINFSAENATKFVILTKEEVFLSDATNVSVCFTTKHKVGALYDVMGIIDINQLNMTSIESRPSLKHNWEYWFYVTFEGKLTDRNVIKALRELKANTDEMIILGTY